jgi:uncharacterized membrane-anchored protein
MLPFLAYSYIVGKNKKKQNKNIIYLQSGGIIMIFGFRGMILDTSRFIFTKSSSLKGSVLRNISAIVGGGGLFILYVVYI